MSLPTKWAKEAEKAVEDLKLEPRITYIERLASLHNWEWSILNGSTKEDMAAAGFRGTEYECIAECTHCWLMLSDHDCKEPLTKHLRESPHCPLAIQREKETPEAIKRAELEAELAEQEAQKEAAKPTPTSRDIGIFDPTLICDIQEFELYSQVMGFLQHLQQIQHQYRESDVLALLAKCLRGPPYAWFKKQTFTSLQDFGKDLASAFPTPSIEPVSIESTPIISTPPIEYHNCPECLAAFSSMSRLLQHTQYYCTGSQVICKHCDAGFNSKNKLHDHIREQHTQKSNLRFPTPESTYKTKGKPAPLAPPTPPATPTSISEPVSPKCSHLPIATLNITPKSTEKLPANCSLTPPASPLRTPVPKHQKPYLTIDDLIRMFRGKSRPFGLPQHQKRRPSPRSPGTPYQSRITAYFLPAANQKAPISQSLKSPKSKSFQQHTSAEPTRTAPASAPALPEKSTVLPYKKPGISYTSLQPRSSFLQPRSSFAWPRPTSPPSFRSPSPDLHVCCTCFGHSSFRSGLFDYPRPSQRYPSNRRPMRGVGGMVSRFGAKLGGNGG